MDVLVEPVAVTRLGLGVGQLGSQRQVIAQHLWRWTHHTQRPEKVRQVEGRNATRRTESIYVRVRAKTPARCRH